MRKDGGWLSPEGHLLWCTQSHVMAIINFPQAFGVTRAHVEATYRTHGEPLGQEANAREELIREAVATGWIRFRRYERDDPRWSMTVQALDAPARSRITGLCSAIIQGTSRGREPQPDLPVRILELGPDTVRQRETVENIARGALIDEGDPLPAAASERHWTDLDPRGADASRS